MASELAAAAVPVTVARARLTKALRATPVLRHRAPAAAGAFA
jgi:hypothetical protein